MHLGLGTPEECSDQLYSVRSMMLCTFLVPLGNVAHLTSCVLLLTAGLRLLQCDVGWSCASCACGGQEPLAPHRALA